MPRARRLSIVLHRGALLAGTVARYSEQPRAHVEDYLAGYLYEPCLAELAAAWLEGWDEADRRDRLGLPSPYTPSVVIAQPDR